MSWIVTMLGWFRAEADRASFSKRFSLSGSEASSAGSTLIATSRAETRVARPVHLSHAAGAERRDDLVGTQTGAG